MVAGLALGLLLVGLLVVGLLVVVLLVVVLLVVVLLVVGLLVVGLLVVGLLFVVLPVVVLTTGFGFTQEHFNDLILSSMYLYSGESARTIHLFVQTINMYTNKQI